MENYSQLVISELAAGPSMNFLRAGDKSPLQRGFFTNSTGNLLLALGFLGGLYNFCNFVIIFSLMLGGTEIQAVYLTDLSLSADLSLSVIIFSLMLGGTEIM